MMITTRFRIRSLAAAIIGAGAFGSTTLYTPSAHAFECDNVGTAATIAPNDNGDATNTACGDGANASGTEATAIGNNATAAGTDALAVGTIATATGPSTSAVGGE